MLLSQGQVLVNPCLCVMFSSGALSQGNNVLYITLEMSEERIAERIDANLLNITIEIGMS